MALSYMFSKFIICLVKNYLQLCFNKIEIKSLHSLLNQCAASAKLPLPEIRYIFSQWQLLQMVFRSMIPNITHHLSMYVVYSKTLLICKKTWIYHKSELYFFLFYFRLKQLEMHIWLCPDYPWKMGTITPVKLPECLFDFWRESRLSEFDIDPMTNWNLESDFIQVHTYNTPLNTRPMLYFLGWKLGTYYMEY